MNTQMNPSNKKAQKSFNEVREEPMQDLLEKSIRKELEFMLRYLVETPDQVHLKELKELQKENEFAKNAYEKNNSKYNAYEKWKFQTTFQAIKLKDLISKNLLKH